MSTALSPSAVAEAINPPVVPIPQSVTDSIRQSLEGLRFGQITINIHDGEVVQIDRVMRIRQFRAARIRS